MPLRFDGSMLRDVDLIVLARPVRSVSAGFSVAGRQGNLPALHMGASEGDRLHTRGIDGLVGYIYEMAWVDRLRVTSDTALCRVLEQFILSMFSV